MNRDTLLRARRASAELDRRRIESPLDYLRWLPLQHEFLADPAKRKQIRAGNQWAGKTTVGLAEGIYHSLGRHPFYDVPPPPTSGAIVCTSWKNSLDVQDKLWAMVPKSEVHPSVEYTPGIGFRGRYPHLKWRNGSITWIVTASQGTLNLAGNTFDWVHFNEPPKTPRVYAELIKRLVRGNPGRAWLTYTPINAPIDYLHELVEEGKIADHWMPLTEAAMVPVGSDRPVRLADGTVCDGAWIEALVADSLPHEVPVVVHGEWEFRVEGNVFRAFRAAGSESHVTEMLPDGKIELQLGIDHGSGGSFSAAAVLVAVKPDPRQPQVWVIDEYVSSGETTEDQDAEAIVGMLRRWGKRWPDLRRAYGDRPWMRGQLQRKSNAQLERAIERALKMPRDTLDPSIRTVKRGPGRGGHMSVHQGAAFVHRAMLAPDGFHVHPRCERLIASLGRWDGSDDQWKHVIDALRYALDAQIFASAGGTARQPKLYVY